MTFPWRRRRHTPPKASNRIATDGLSFELTIPSHFLCPISLDLMKDPVSLATGITYDRENIERWLDHGSPTCPVTNQVLTSFDLLPNHVLRKMIQEWCVKNKSYGIERIPTPKIPITSFEASDICAQIKAAAQSADEAACLELLGKIKNLARESERNKRCLVENGIGSHLAEMFEAFSKLDDHNMALSEDILRAFTWCFPLGERGVSTLKSRASLRRISKCLACEEPLSLRQNAVFLLKELLLEDQESTDGLVEIEGFEEMLANIVKEPICNKTTQACLIVIHRLISRSPAANSRFVEIGLTSILLERLIDGNGNKSICEKALGVLDNICNLVRGREAMYDNALTIPLLVKKILRISNGATELIVSILWKQIRLGGKEECIVEALQSGAFQKLLVVLQVGCGETTKEKVNELLKMMSLQLHGDQINDCFDSFKYVKRST